MDGETSSTQDQHQVFFHLIQSSMISLSKTQVQQRLKAQYTNPNIINMLAQSEKISKGSTCKNPLKGSLYICKMVMNKLWSHSPSGNKLWNNTTMFLSLDTWVCIGLWITFNEHFGGKAYGEMSENTCDPVRSVDL